VPVTTGTLLLKALDGAHEAKLTCGVPNFRQAGVEHDVINANAYDFTFVETELK
jgi:hypothetical protein